VREAQIVPPLDDWIAGVFEPDRLAETCRSLADAREPAPEDDGRAEAARQELVDCMPESPATGKRSRPERTRPSSPGGSAKSRLRERRPRRNSGDVVQRPLSPRTTSGRWSRASGISSASWRPLKQQKKAALYENLGLALKYEPSKRRVLVEADLGRCTSGSCRRGDLNPHGP
jgi:hypothetical protein